MISGTYSGDDIVQKVSDTMSSAHLGDVKKVGKKGSFHTIIVFSVANDKEMMTFIEWWRSLVPLLVL